MDPNQDKKGEPHETDGLLSSSFSELHMIKQREVCELLDTGIGNNKSYSDIMDLILGQSAAIYTKY
jgi:hypothetical protein